MKTLALAVLLAAAFLVASPEARADVEAQLRGRAVLTPPVASPQPDASGFVEIRSRVSGQQFRVEVIGVDGSNPVEIFVEDPTHAMVSAGVLPEGSPDRMLVLDTASGDALPADATSVVDLVGRAVEVREPDGDVVLAGVVPALENFEDERPAYGRSSLMRDEIGHGKKAYGSIRCWTRNSGDEIRIQVRRLDGASVYELFLEDGSGTMTSVGTEESSHPGSVSFEFDTRDDDDLPLEAWSVHDLAGRRVEIRESGGGDTILFGRIPPATRSALKIRRTDTVEDDDSDGRARIDARVDYRSGRERLRIDLHRIAGGPGDVELWLDDGTGNLVMVAEEKMKKSGRARFEWDNRKGDPLPLLAESLTQLSGRAFEVRVGGVATLAGNLPTF